MKTNNIKFIEKKSVYIDPDVKIGRNVVIYPNNYILGKTIIKDNVILLPNNYIKDSIVGENCKIEFSHVDQGEIGNDCSIGPFARLRPNAKIGNNCKVGNFVEIKNSTIGNGTKVSHLAYVGDAQIGNNCNIGCGAIFVNYNGKSKNKTIVEDNCFIGSNANIIAPVCVAKNTYICAGTTLTVNTQENDFIIGRSRETIKHNYSQKYKKGE